MRLATIGSAFGGMMFAHLERTWPAQGGKQRRGTLNSDLRFISTGTRFDRKPRKDRRAAEHRCRPGMSGRPYWCSPASRSRSAWLLCRNPMLGNVAAGGATIVTSRDHTHIHPSTPKSSINCQSLNIKKHESKHLQ